VLRGHLGPQHVSGVKVVGDWRLGLPSEPAQPLLRRAEAAGLGTLLRYR
jgi:hypothetical protein